MGRLFLMFMPWWAFAFLAFTCGSLAVSFYEDYRAAQTEEFFALNEGPPAVVNVEQFNGSRDIGYFDEVHINGGVLANFGVIQLRGEGPDFDGIVLGNDAGLPLAVVLFDTASFERQINQLVSTAAADKRVTVQGFLTSTRRSDVERAITRQGYSGQNLLVLEPYFENRAGIIAEKNQDAQFVFFITAGIAALFAILAVWRFRHWRKRRAAKKIYGATKRRKASHASMPTPAPAQKPTARSSNPWGGKQKPEPAKQPVPRPSAPSRTVALSDSEPDAPAVTMPTFQSVFPHGESSFQFKTSDQIVRQYFGTITKIGGSNADS